MKHAFSALISGFVWIFVVGSCLLIAEKLFGLQLEDSENVAVRNGLAWLVVVVFWVAAIAGWVSSVRRSEAEEARQQLAQEALREQIKKSVMDELRKGSK